MTRLRAQGHNVIEMWECEWTQLKQTSPDILAYVNSLQFVEPLNPRNAFCGGRTNAVKLFHHVTPGQKIHYIDYTSLYPWVNKMCIYPKGHPQFISQPGTMSVAAPASIVPSCVALPSRQQTHLSSLRHLHTRQNGQRSYQCAHSDHQRALSDTCCTPNCKKSSSWATKSSTATRCGIFTKPAKASSETT